MDNPVIDEFLKYINSGSMAGVLFCVWYWMKYIWPIQRKQRDDDILARQDDNKLKRTEMRVLVCFLEHLKKEGYAIDVPDLTKEI